MGPFHYYELFHIKNYLDVPQGDHYSRVVVYCMAIGLKIELMYCTFFHR